MMRAHRRGPLSCTTIGRTKLDLHVHRIFHLKVVGVLGNQAYAADSEERNNHHGCHREYYPSVLFPCILAA